MAENYVVSSFIPEVVLELKTRTASIHLGIICDKPNQLPYWRENDVEYLIPHLLAGHPRPGAGGA